MRGQRLPDMRSRPSLCRTGFPVLTAQNFRLTLHTATMSRPTPEPLRDFETVRRKLESLVLQLKATTDPQGRRRLLRETRLMLAEADRLVSLAK